MRDRISELMDGELDQRAAEATIAALRRDPEAGDAWRTYHVISDAIRSMPLLSERFSARFAERLAVEPTILGAARRVPRPSVAWAAAASVAAVGLVGWLAFGPQREPAAPVAAAPKRQPVVAVTTALPKAANDYLLAHQGFSPRVYLQGMAPYVRTVSEPAEEPAR